MAFLSLVTHCLEVGRHQCQFIIFNIAYTVKWSFFSPIIVLGLGFFWDIQELQGQSYSYSNVRINLESLIESWKRNNFLSFITSSEITKKVPAVSFLLAHTYWLLLSTKAKKKNWRQLWSKITLPMPFIVLKYVVVFFSLRIYFAS